MVPLVVAGQRESEGPDSTPPPSYERKKISIGSNRTCAGEPHSVEAYKHVLLRALRLVSANTQSREAKRRERLSNIRAEGGPAEGRALLVVDECLAAAGDGWRACRAGLLGHCSERKPEESEEGKFREHFRARGDGCAVTIAAYRKLEAGSLYASLAE